MIENKSQTIGADQDSQAQQSLEISSSENSNEQVSLEQGNGDSDKNNNHPTPRFLHRALRAQARALNQDFEPYKPDEEIVERLKNLDELDGSKLQHQEQESLSEEQYRAQEDKAQGLDPKESKPQETEQKSRFFNKVTAMQDTAKRGKIEGMLKNNFRLFIIIVFAFIGYYLYGEYIRKSEINSFEDLKANLPLQLDDYTTLQRIEEQDGINVMVIHKDESLYKDLSLQEIQKKLDLLALNAQNLCTIPPIFSMIEEGKKLKVLLLSSQAKSMYTIENCDKFRIKQ